MGAVAKAKTEFDKWVNDFIKNRDARLQDLSRNEADIRNRESQLDRKWRPLYSTFFDTIFNLIKAYNKRTGSHISFEVSPKNLNFKSMNIFSGQAAKAEVKVFFDPATYWLITLGPSSVREDKLPTIYIKVMDMKDKDHRGPAASIGINPSLIQRPVILLHDEFGNMPIKNNYKLSSKSAKEIAKSFFEFQLLQLDK